MPAAATTFETLTVETADRICTITMDRPKVYNAINDQLTFELQDALKNAARDDATGVVILTGAGKAFCAGLDLKELGDPAAPRDAATDREMLAAIGAFEGPVIGAINGFAITGGFELALACDLLIASTGARFADTHARVGLVPGWGLSQRLSRLIGIQRAKRVSLTGNFIDAETAAAWGLVTEVVAPDELLPTCRALAADMLGCIPEMLRAYKRVIDDGYEVTFGDGLRIERKANREFAKTLTAESIERLRSAVQARGREQAGG